MKPRMSFFVTRPPVPVPGTWLGSTPCSDAMRATTGETNVLPLPLAAAAAAGVTGAAGAGCGSEGCSGCAVGVTTVSADAAWSASAAASWVAGSGGASSAAGAPTSAPSGAIVASFVPTSTVSPSWTKISARTPVPGDGISVSTLSVEISSRDSSASTVSPGCFSHFVIVPSDTETPICGITTSTVWVVAMRLLSTRRAPAGLRSRPRPAG